MLRAGEVACRGPMQTVCVDLDGRFPAGGGGRQRLLCVLPERFLAGGLCFLPQTRAQALRHLRASGPWEMVRRAPSHPAQAAAMPLRTAARGSAAAAPLCAHRDKVMLERQCSYSK